MMEEDVADLDTEDKETIDDGSTSYKGSEQTLFD
jgi:hypothetical protein